MGLGASIRTGMPGTPDDAFSAASQVEVYERIGEVTTYTIRLPVTAVDDDLSWLGDRRVAPGASLGVFVAGSLGEACLVRGPVTGHAARIAHGGAGSYVDVLGADASVQLDRSVRTRVWDSDARDSDAVSSIVSGAGFTADVRTTQAVHRANLRPLAQSDTDLRFVRRLARRNGFFAWLTSDPLTGLDTFHFQPPPVEGAVANTLIINQADANTDAVDLSWDTERPTAVDALQLDLLTLENADAAGTTSPTRALGSQRLSDLLASPQTSRIVAPADDASELKARAEGAAVDAEWFVSASLETTLAGLGSPVRSHTVVELRGMGRQHSGKYLVVGVRHLIDATGHRMTVELARNAWGA
jgi:phage protein D